MIRTRMARYRVRLGRWLLGAEELAQLRAAGSADAYAAGELDGLRAGRNEGMDPWVRHWADAWDRMAALAVAGVGEAPTEAAMAPEAPQRPCTEPPGPLPVPGSATHPLGASK